MAVAAWGRVGPLRVRMGIHTGQAVLEEGDYAVSHTFNRAARLMSAGHRGQILLSQETAALVRSQLPADDYAHIEEKATAKELPAVIDQLLAERPHVADAFTAS